MQLRNSEEVPYDLIGKLELEYVESIQIEW